MPTIEIGFSESDRHSVLPHVCAVFREAGQDVGARLETVVMNQGVAQVRYTAGALAGEDRLQFEYRLASLPQPA